MKGAELPAPTAGREPIFAASGGCYNVLFNSGKSASSLIRCIGARCVHERSSKGLAHCSQILSAAVGEMALIWSWSGPCQMQ